MRADLIKKMMGGLYRDKQFKSSNSKYHDELVKLWNLTSRAPHQHESHLEETELIKILVFPNLRSVSLWEMLSLYRIPIELYARLFKKQHGYDFKIIVPDTINAEYRGEISAVLSPPFDNYSNLLVKYNPGRNAISVQHCPLCHGLNSMIVLRAGDNLFEDDIPSLPYRLRCIHGFYQPDSKTKRGMPEILKG